MPAIFIHLSDIHFGQEKNTAVHTHDDVKEQLIADAANLISDLHGGKATGILVTGDIAQAGKKGQYDVAGVWLDRLANAVGCEVTSIQMVPGNHDLDRDRSSRSLQHLLPELLAGGSDEYESVLCNEVDRQALFARFTDYINFSEAYNCPLDLHGKFTEKAVEIAPDRWIRFVRMNSSLLCSEKDSPDEPKLFIGARQFTKIPRRPGEENVVLIHHPLNWYKDAEDAWPYIRSRSRVFITGHEHFPRVKVENVEDGSDIMMLAAGATVPYKSDGQYTYSYNILEFDWDKEKDALAVKIFPRAWNPKHTRFDADNAALQGNDPRFVLGSPKFRERATKTNQIANGPKPPSERLVAIVDVEDQPGSLVSEPEAPSTKTAEQHEPDGYRFALLRFFRDLVEAERIRILLDLDAVPADFDDPITHNVQRELLDELAEQGRIVELARKIEDTISTRKRTDSHE
ncbi:metallophosphoesterase [uncultured Pseudacidovorax sp.]|uniref:metallophosphoesterase n=1 Tax=uncultured Pseudacidovorax sp. TaxID=679313 RepID=UPI0026003F3D|nr:metallophosphoesterase [uncultured Pseudacidovorax sp.]